MTGLLAAPAASRKWPPGPRDGLTALLAVAALIIGAAAGAAETFDESLSRCVSALPPLEQLLAHPDSVPGFEGQGSEELVSYYLCRAVEADDVGACFKLRHIPSRHFAELDLDEFCEADFLRLRFAKSLIGRRADALEHCTEALQWFASHTQCGPPVEDAFDSRGLVGYHFRQCAVILENADSPLRGAAFASRACDRADHSQVRGMDKFLEWLAALSGRSSCSTQYAEPDKLCPAVSRFRRASDARDARLCESDPLCLAMLGAGSRGCELFAWRFKHGVCRERLSARR